MAGERIVERVPNRVVGDMAVFLGLSQMPVLAPNPTAFLTMGATAVSERGETGIYSGNFAGCMGAIVVPTRGSGGLVSHIHQMLSRGDMHPYLLEAVTKSVQKAGSIWLGQIFDVVLFRGEIKEGGAMKYRKLADHVRSIPSVRNVLDLREVHDLAGDALLYDTGRQILYCWSGHWQGAINATDEIEPRSTSSIDLEHCTEPLLVAHHP